MKKLFISQPMKGKTDEEIQLERNRIIDKIKRDYGEVEIIDTFFKDEFKSCENNNINIPLKFLAKSIDKLAEADIAYFAKDWEKYRGCRIEYTCAREYNIEYIIKEKDEHIITSHSELLKERSKNYEFYFNDRMEREKGLIRMSEKTYNGYTLPVVIRDYMGKLHDNYCISLHYKNRKEAYILIDRDIYDNYKKFTIKMQRCIEDAIQELVEKLPTNNKDLPLESFVKVINVLKLMNEV